MSHLAVVADNIAGRNCLVLTFQIRNVDHETT